ncbi:MAG TPA: tRNA (adenosine(37)-N6)-threonylcarbamoyltransferase complex dimerization subunit type 1 TsaB [Reyranella sp.]|jgi:tRNA threonylcarbamoyladenosine biosynthesis protein TsaB|nr:tRNA (adenosine(37)-N6)-threonylcarbamoyltransferase complex dimerization subunit type 1 TsaB [Reyranella sp.]
MSLVLAYDCAVSGLGLALVRDDGAPVATHREDGREQAARLLPAIAGLLDKADAKKNEIRMIAVTVGPGSFTGVRVGLAAARGLAVALAVPLAGFTTTSVLLAQTAPTQALAVAAIDTKLGDWYCAFASEAPFVASAESLAARLAGRACTIVGPDVEALAARIPNATARPAAIDPVTLARLALADGVDAWRARNKQEGLPRPLYLRGVNVTAPDGSRRTVD